MKDGITFSVEGSPVPKQSFHYTSRGGGFTDLRVKAWQNQVAWEAKRAMDDRELFLCNLEVHICFYLNHQRRTDIDNLSKGVLDSCNGIVWKDDRQIMTLNLEKKYCDNPGIQMTVFTRE